MVLIVVIHVDSMPTFMIRFNLSIRLLLFSMNELNQLLHCPIPSLNQVSLGKRRIILTWWNVCMLSRVDAE